LNDRQAVEEAVRAYLERRTRGEEATGRLDFRGLEVVQVATERASARIEASTKWDIDHPVHGRRTFIEDLSGTVELERDDGGWRVVDFTVDGRPVSRSRTKAQGRVEVSGLRVEDVVLDLRAQVTSLDFVVENAGPRPVVVYEVVRGARVLGRWFYIPVPLTNPVEVGPGDRGSLYAGWKETFPLDTEELRFVVRAGEVDGSHRFELPFAVRRAPDAELVALGRAPWWARLSVRRRRWLQLAPLGVFGVLLVLRQFRAAGIVFALEGLAVAVIGGYLWLVRRRGRPDSRFVLAALATVAFGVWLAWLDPS
jgi:hypothetical protein